MTKRDMTRKAFAAAIERYGFEPQGFLGYYRLPIDGHHINVSALNAGPRKRDQLAYLLKMLDKHEKIILEESSAPS